MHLVRFLLTLNYDALKHELKILMEITGNSDHTSVQCFYKNAVKGENDSTLKSAADGLERSGHASTAITDSERADR